MGLWNIEIKGTGKKNIDPRIIIWGWGALEADFLRFYKIDLVYEGFSKRLTWRKFLILTRGLPEDSAFSRFYNNKDNRNFVESDIDI